MTASIDSARPTIALDAMGEQLTSPQFAQLISGAQTQYVKRLLFAIGGQDGLDASLLEQLPRLRLVAVSATGVNNVDLAACRARGIPVCNVRNYGADTVAEHAFMLMMAVSLMERWFVTEN